ncbi:hypothetical protein Lser_V15G15741 [Lactuca serriola]
MAQVNIVKKLSMLAVVAVVLSAASSVSAQAPAPSLNAEAAFSLPDSGIMITDPASSKFKFWWSGASFRVRSYQSITHPCIDNSYSHTMNEVHDDQWHEGWMNVCGIDMNNPQW